MACSDHRRSAELVALVTLMLAGCSGPKATWRAAPAITPSPSVSASVAASTEDSCVAATLAPMTLNQLAGQVMLVGTPVDDAASVDAVLRSYDIGGIFLAGRSHASAGTLHSAIVALQAIAPAGVRLLISLDQEGGEVQTLQGTDFPPIPTAVAQGRLSPSALRAQTTAWARRLATIGVNLDLAPVADTVPAALGTRNPPIGAFYREYGSEPATVTAAITTVVPAIQSTGVLTSLKHFPGLGRVTVNTDFSAGATDATMTAHDPYLGPFVAGIHAGAGAVMISSASYPKLDPHSIATFSSPIVTGLLRHQLGFTGLIVSDSLAGAAAVASVPVGQRAVRFIGAGGDLVLTTQASKAPAMVDALLAAARSSATFAAQLRVAAGYVVRAKYAEGLLGCSPARP